MDGPEYGAFELSQLARELETELAATQKLLREEREHFADMLAQRDAEREKVAKLRKIANHSPGCAAALTVWKPCSCGRDQILLETI